MKVQLLLILTLNFISSHSFSKELPGKKCNKQPNRNEVLQPGRLDYIKPEMRQVKKGKFFVDQQTGLCVKRITDHKNEPPETFARIDYARRQAFNADSSLILVYSMSGYWHLYNAKSGRYYKQLNGPTTDAELYWDPVKPQIIYYTAPYGGLKIHELNVRNNQSRVVADFRNRLPWRDAARVWTKSEGRPSADGRYWGFQVETEDYQPLGLLTWDKEKDSVIATWDFSMHQAGRPDHTSMSPSGEYIVASWNESKLGTMAFTKDFRRRVKLHHKSEHSDLVLLPNGHDAYVSIDYQSNGGPVFMVEIQTGERTNLFDSYINGTVSAFHFSGTAYKKPGWVLISSYGSYADKPKHWLHERIFAIDLSLPSQVYTLANHHSAGSDYWTEPHATVNQDFSKVVFNSNLGKKPETDIDIYQIEIPKFAKLAKKKSHSSKKVDESHSKFNRDKVRAFNALEDSKILFVGNTLTGHFDIPKLLKKMAEEKEIKLTVDTEIYGGKYFKDHYERISTAQKIKSGNYNIVVLQGGEYGAISDTDGFFKYGGLLGDMVRDSNKELVYYMTWHHRDYFKTEAELVKKNYMKLANKKNDFLVPVGIAFAKVTAEHPDIELFFDGTYQNQNGAYLSALMFYAYLFKQDPLELDFNAEIDSNNARIFKRVVKQVLEEYQR
ncbi:hypothetical protein [Aliikangiella sp. IMCC44359]|uniref:hypothetical protein n=1 Tax=Aliikangiella sp. IMCC44359 TaxID=3459125 RepID=UPI00403AD668